MGIDRVFVFRKAPPKCAMPLEGDAPPKGRKAARFYGLSPKTDYRRTGGKWYRGGEPVTGRELERLEAMRLPPAWRRVHVAADPKAKLQAVGVDAKGRVQRRYSAEFVAGKAQQKFARVRRFSKDLPGIRRKVGRSADPEAMLLRLEDRTAMRIGGSGDLRAKVRSYGLTTLEGRHVSVKGTTVKLDYVAKKGVRQTKVFRDKKLAAWLQERKAAAGANGQLFPDVSPGKLNGYLQGMSGGKYSVKDFRTLHATRIAYNELKAFENTAMTAVQRKRAVKAAAEKASKFLGNTPSMARKAYIDPQVWELIGGLP